MKQILTAALLLLAMTASAQKNPMRGYVVTLQNDTLRGTVDYLSGTKNAWTCLFRRDGETEFKSYTPQDIKGYRLTDNGAYYVSRTLPLHGEQQTFFAEYLLKGGVNVYRHEEGDREYFYLEDEDGQIAELQGREHYDLSQQETSSERHKALQSAFLLLAKSEEAKKALWESRINSRNLVDITRRYNEQFCTSSGDCIEFRYSERQTASTTIRLRAEGGIAVNQLSVGGGRKNVLAPRIAVGVDCQFPRINPGFSLQAALACSFGSTDMETAQRYAYTQEGNSVYYSDLWKVKYTQLAIQLGVAWRFIPKGKVCPYVKAGFSNEFVIFSMDNVTHHFDDGGQTKCVPQLCWYAGGGVSFAVGSHRLYIDGSYGHTLLKGSGEFKYVPQTVTATIGWMF